MTNLWLKVSEKKTHLENIFILTNPIIEMVWREEGLKIEKTEKK